MSEAPRPPLRILAVSTALAIAAAVLTYALLRDTDEAEPPIATIELTPADGAASFETFDGERVTLDSLRGEPVLVNFFASTCVPCVTEMPALEEVHQELGDEIRFLGIATQSDRPEDALALVERTGVTYETGRDADGEVVAALGATVLPTTVLLDANGEVVAAHAGQLEADELRELLADELGIGT